MFLHMIGYNNLPDYYVKVTVNNVLYETQEVDGTQTPAWNRSFNIPNVNESVH